MMKRNPKNSGWRDGLSALVFRLPCGGLEGSLKNWNG